MVLRGHLHNIDPISSTDISTAYVPGKEGWCSIIGLEAPLGSLKNSRRFPAERPITGNLELDFQHDNRTMNNPNVHYKYENKWRLRLHGSCLVMQRS